jgi:hypothetical protein
VKIPRLTVQQRVDGRPEPLRPVEGRYEISNSVTECARAAPGAGFLCRPGGRHPSAGDPRHGAQRVGSAPGKVPCARFAIAGLAGLNLVAEPRRKPVPDRVWRRWTLARSRSEAQMPFIQDRLRVPLVASLLCLSLAAQPQQSGLSEPEIDAAIALGKSSTKLEPYHRHTQLRPRLQLPPASESPPGRRLHLVRWRWRPRASPRRRRPALPVEHEVRRRDAAESFTRQSLKRARAVAHPTNTDTGCDRSREC